MEEKTKHIIAHTIYVICKILVRELKLVLKPLGIGILIWGIFNVVAEWDHKEPFFLDLGNIGFFLPMIVFYYKRIRAWVLKWK